MPHRLARRRAAAPVVRSALVRFAAWSLVALLALVLGIVFAANRVAYRHGVNDATARAERLSSLFVGPLLDDSVRRGEPKAADPIAAVLSTSLREGTIRHVKLWSEDGSIIWSDRPALVGQSFDLPGEVEELFGTTRSVAEVSDLSRQENVAEREEGELLEVYVGSRDADGEPFVFEAYLSTEPIDQQQGDIVAGVLPVAIGALALFQLAVLPMALTLARRVQRSEVAQTRMTAHALRASELERQRVAQELHDGVVQDLAGVGFSFRGIERGITDTPEGEEARATLQRIGDIVRADVMALRTMMLDIHPPNLEEEGLAGAVLDLAERKRARGFEVTAVVPERLDVTVNCARVVYRVVREGLQNVEKHSGAHRAHVEIVPRQDELVVRVADDGSGPDAAPDSATTKGHLGLRLLEEAVSDLGGSLTLRTARDGDPLNGAVLEARLPL